MRKWPLKMARMWQMHDSRCTQLLNRCERQNKKKMTKKKKVKVVVVEEEENDEDQYKQIAPRSIVCIDVKRIMLFPLLVSSAA